MNIVATFSCALYGEAEASILVREWCATMEHYYGIWMAQDSWEYEFKDDDIKSYTPREEFIDLFVGLPLDSQTMVRASAIYNMRPGRPQAP